MEFKVGDYITTKSGNGFLGVVEKLNENSILGKIVKGSDIKEFVFKKDRVRLATKEEIENE